MNEIQPFNMRKWPKDPKLPCWHYTDGTEEFNEENEEGDDDAGPSRAGEGDEVGASSGEQDDDFWRSLIWENSYSLFCFVKSFHLCMMFIGQVALVFFGLLYLLLCV
ncbi:hypothetical protein ACH5RR_036854 [Cinchona calisaya]|uniref:Uncharacterized protein n=1 Tax=Cinchona calisaya TaxID=153742 RepID=A0ABD2Y9B6_9GENT